MAQEERGRLRLINYLVNWWLFSAEPGNGGKPLQNHNTSVVAPSMVENPFKFIAFDQDTGEMLAHGSRAIDALALADRAAPSAVLIVLCAGELGAWFWTAKISLALARTTLDSD